MSDNEIFGSKRIEIRKFQIMHLKVKHFVLPNHIHCIFADNVY